MPEPAVWYLSLPEPLKDRKKRCICENLFLIKILVFYEEKNININVDIKIVF